MQLTGMEQIKLAFKGKKNVSFKQPMMQHQQREILVSSQARSSQDGLEDISGIGLASETNSSNTAGCNKSLVISLPNKQSRVNQIMIKTPTHNAYCVDSSVNSGNSTQKFSSKSIKITKQKFQSVLGIPTSKSPVSDQDASHSDDRQAMMQHDQNAKQGMSSEEEKRQPLMMGGSGETTVDLLFNKIRQQLSGERQSVPAGTATNTSGQGPLLRINIKPQPSQTNCSKDAISPLAVQSFKRLKQKPK